MVKLTHGGDIYSYGSLSDTNRLIDFSANINPLGLPEGVKQAFMKSMDYSSNYPDPLCRELVKQTALHENVPEDYIFCGNGAADIIYRIAAAIQPRNTLVTAPAFSEYEEAVRTVNSKVRYYRLKRENGFKIDEGIIDYVTSDMDLVFLCNPNNPTGELLDKKTVLALADKCKESNCLLVVDECFVDFLENIQEFSIVDSLGTYDNVMVLKAFTKIYAMAGLRLGYAICSNKGILERLASAGQPWSVSVPAQQCGIAALKETDYLNKTRIFIKQNREYLLESLRNLGFEVFDSRANYILFRSENNSLKKELEKYGILIRSCHNYVGLDNTYFRIAVKSREDNEYLAACLKKIAASGGS
ncbi:MAG: aminotransferase class [Eubacterium sp.]|jgi:L-threonine-O-3-phosphate decarboxylase|nr:aminotransferase class [Eubacterium sp.]